MTIKRSLFGAALSLLLSAGALPCLAANIKRVGTDATAQYTTIEAAIASVPDRNTEPVIVEIAPGRYDGRILIPKAKPFITLRGTGDDRDAVRLTGTLKPNERAWVSLEADDCALENLTIHEQTQAGTDDQRSALMLSGQRQSVENCAILGWHNTLAIWNGARAYLHFCRVSGIGDTVYGPGTAVLDTCDIVSTRNGGTMATPLTPKESACGLVFLDCRLLGAQTGKARLMRPWGPDAHAAFIRCTIGPGVDPVGWMPWNGREKTCRAETDGGLLPDGKAAPTAGLPAWVRLLPPKKAREYTVRTIFPDWDPHASENLGIGSPARPAAPAGR